MTKLTRQERAEVELSKAWVMARRFGRWMSNPVLRSMFPSKSRGEMMDLFATSFHKGTEWARVDLFENILRNIEESGVEDTITWMQSRYNFEKEKLAMPPALKETTHEQDE